MDELIEASEALEECLKKNDVKKEKGASVKGTKNLKKCEELDGENQKCISGIYSGGRHNTLQKGGNACSPERESHHMPSDKAYSRLNGGKVGKGTKPAIQMDAKDHALTASYGYTLESIAYQEQQKALIRLGQYKLAMMRDIADIRVKFGSKYDKAIGEMIIWAKCMKYI